MANKPVRGKTSDLMQDVPGTFPTRSVSQQLLEQRGTFQSLSSAVHARRADYVERKHVRIKIGSWNVANYKGTEQDIGGWFVEGKGIADAFSGLRVGSNEDSPSESGKSTSETEIVADQEARYERKKATLPVGDPGTVTGGDDIGLYVLGLQEIVDLGSAAEALRPYTDPSAANIWKDAMAKALPEGYQLIAEQQLIGLLLLVYASADVAKEVKSVSTTSVGTGLMGYMGNKGAVTARIVIGDTTRLVFINSHLAAGADKAALERRNWDAAQIIQRTKFEPIQDAMDLAQSTGEQIGDEDFAFWVGDLNYRLEGIPGDDVRRLLMLHTRNQYDLSQPSARKIEREIEEATASVKHRAAHPQSASSQDSGSPASSRPSSEITKTDLSNTPPSTLVDIVTAKEDPASLQTTLSSLLPHDELRQQMKKGKAFQDGWREGEIGFLPTYKYDAGSVGVFDSSEKKRSPSWCDRILYRTRKDKLAYDAKRKEAEEVKRKDEQMTASGIDEADNDESILYDYDPETDAADPLDEELTEQEQAEHDVVITKEGFEDELKLECYTAHQRVLSSDHKPLNAIFSLKYDAVVPELKARVHAEVAKNLDRIENEGRPYVTVVVEQHSDTQAEQCDEHHRDFEGVTFGGVRWGQAKHRSLTIANTGQVTASFSFIERPVDDGQAHGIAPSWLNMKVNGESVSSSSSSTTKTTIEPGDTVTAELEIRILDMSLVHLLNDGSKELNDVLVLRVDGGRDHFIPVTAEWYSTSLGRSINKLVRIPEGGIRKLQNQHPGSGKKKDRPTSSSGANEGDDEPVRFSAPRELFRLTETIEELATRVIAEWDMLSTSESTAPPWIAHPGWPFDEQCWTERSTSLWADAASEACNALDADHPLEASLPDDLPRIQRLYVLSSFLLFYLDNIGEGIINQELWAKLESCVAGWEKAKHMPAVEERRTAIQDVLAESTSHSASFILITAMLARVRQEVASVSDLTAGTPQSPKSPGTLRRVRGRFVTLPAESPLKELSTVWAQTFARVMFKTTPASSKKANAVQERRKAEVLELFLRSDEPD